ncbi:MAG: prepilin-type N-terminal cleavage/methylation domain-containing protein [Gammaproteobacteria bacterium]
MLRKPSQGFSLVELLLAMSLGLFLLSGVLYLFASLLDMNAQLLRRQRLQQELRALMTVMVRDIQRSGYWAHAQPPAAPNPFAAYQILEEGHCLLYHYDGNRNGTLDAEERAGFKLAAGMVRARRKASACDGAACDGSCNRGRWWRLSDPAVVHITRLDFRETANTLRLSDDKRLLLRALHITLAGALRHFPGERLTLQASIHLPNAALPP